jgi:hypothetical protein
MPLAAVVVDVFHRVGYHKFQEVKSMIESREETVHIEKGNMSSQSAVSETAPPSVSAAAAPAIVVGNREMQEPTSRERPTDKRFVQRHANAVKARSGHRRNIRRSNTNG